MSTSPSPSPSTTIGSAADLARTIGTGSFTGSTASGGGGVSGGRRRVAGLTIAGPGIFVPNVCGAPSPAGGCSVNMFHSTSAGNKPVAVGLEVHVEQHVADAHQAARSARARAGRARCPGAARRPPAGGSRWLRSPTESGRRVTDGREVRPGLDRVDRAAPRVHREGGAGEREHARVVRRSERVARPASSTSGTDLHSSVGAVVAPAPHAGRVHEAQAHDHPRDDDARPGRVRCAASRWCSGADAGSEQAASPSAMSRNHARRVPQREPAVLPDANALNSRRRSETDGRTGTIRRR